MSKEKNKQNKKNKDGGAAAAIAGLSGALTTALIGFSNRTGNSDTATHITLILMAVIILIAALIIVISAKRTKRKNETARREKEAKRREEEENLDTEKLDFIMKEIERRSALPAFRIKPEKADNIGISESKFGGYPYWEEKDEYPKGSDGKPLYLLAQINFAELPEKNPLLPEKGLLQFFVSGDVYSGANFENQTDQSNFRVIYHADIELSVTEQSVKALGIKAMSDANGTDDEDCLPLTTQEKLTFEAFTDYSYFGTDECDALVENILRDSFGTPLIDGSVWKTFNDAEYDYLSKADGLWCSKILGHAEFTQSDPRSWGKYDAGHYNTLLLQIDSDDEIMWGDCGIANFFINAEALQSLDFSDVLYNWDCY